MWVVAVWTDPDDLTILELDREAAESLAKPAEGRVDPVLPRVRRHHAPFG
jgi:hypothetical protein